MAYSTSNPPNQLLDTIGGTSGLWHYSSADADGTVNGAGYFTNGGALGMKEGDFVFVYDTGNDQGSTHVVTGVTAGGAATVAFITTS